ncbi:MAG TPA: hypothetical protein VJN96_27385 [Vicinamibacterales bacterium]|nr:hypothetical protein [Vicinamibacterales bacterium]
MSCVKHFLGIRWERHTWDRRVTLARDQSSPQTDMWGRSFLVPVALCHTEYVCRRCGAIKDDGDCFCEKAEADACAIRLAWLAEVRDEHAQPPMRT